MFWAAIAAAGRLGRSLPYLLIAALIAWGLYERHQAHKWQDRAQQCQTASQASAAQTKVMREAEAKAYQEKADAVDQSYRAGLGQARALSAAYVDAHRVQPQADRSAAKPVSEAADAAKPADVPGTAVMVAESDVQLAGEWQAYGVTCHDYLVSITK